MKENRRKLAKLLEEMKKPLAMAQPAEEIVSSERKLALKIEKKLSAWLWLKIFSVPSWKAKKLASKRRKYQQRKLGGEDAGKMIGGDDAVEENHQLKAEEK